MKAIVDFEATRQHIEYAVRVFSEGFTQERIRLDKIRDDWAAEKARKAWFYRSFSYWREFAAGHGGIDSYRIKYETLNKTNYEWFEAKLSDAKQLLARFNCATNDCEASTIYLSDDDLSLLSVSLQSALGG